MSSSRGASSGPAPDLVPPAHLWVPERMGTAGPIVSDLAAMFGLVQDGHQRLAVESICSVKAEDPLRWAALEAAIVEPRQNGKSVGVLLPIALYVALSKPDQLVVWSAHRYKTSREAFLALLKLYRGSALLRSKVARVVYSNGEEAFEFKNGSRIVFVARSQASGRGLSGDLVILDEALFLTAVMMGALFPTLSARENPLVLYASSACLSESDVLRAIVDRGRAGGDPSLVLVEWCAPEGGCQTEGCDHARDAVGCACDDPVNHRAANPSERITLEYVVSERRALPPEEFARERMGWHEKPAAPGQPIRLATWEALAGDIGLNDPVVLGADVSPGHRSAAIVATDGRGVEVVEHRPGSAWLVERFAELVAAQSPKACAWDPSGPIGTLGPEFATAGIDMTAVEGKDAVRACDSVVKAVHEGTVRHRGEPEFTAAIEGARWRDVGDGHKWSRKDSTVDITPLVAATVALWVAASGDSEVITPGIWFV